MSASTTRSPALEPETLDARGEDLVKLHALVDDLETARLAVEGGATVVQWRLKNVPRVEVVERGRRREASARAHGVTFVVNDDIEAALMLGADGVHLGRKDEGADRAREQGLLLGLSASNLEEALAADGEADYIGAGPVWPTPSKADADPAIGLEGLREICDGVPRFPSSRSAGSTPRTPRSASAPAP